MKRICPNCQAKLGLSDHLFCSKCGNELPKELYLRDDSFVQVTHLKESPRIKNNFRRSFFIAVQKYREFKGKKIVFGLCAFAIFMTVGLVVLIKTRDPFAGRVGFPTVEKDYKMPTKGVFGVRVLAEYVPYDVDVYLETADFSLVGELFINYDEGYFKLVQDLEKHVLSHSGFFVTDIDSEPTMSVVLFPKVIDFNLEEIDISEYAWLHVELFDNAILISPKEEVIQQMRQAKGGIIKSMAKNAEFVTFSNGKKADGDVVMYTASPTVKLVLTTLLMNSGSPRLVEIAKKCESSTSNFIVF